MSHLQQQIRAVQRRLALRLFVNALGWAALGVAVIVWIAFLCDRLLYLSLPHGMRWWALGLTMAGGIIAAWIWAIAKRPPTAEVARIMDDELGTKDRFATSFYLQTRTDAFADATRHDAEAAASSISLRHKFRPRFPRTGYLAGLVILALLLTLWLLPAMDLLHRRQYAQQQSRREQTAQEAKQAVRQALAQVRSVPTDAADARTLKQAEDSLKALLDQPEIKPDQAHRKALEALQGVDESMRQKIESSAQYAQNQQQREIARSLTGSDDENPSLKDIRQAMKQGDFAQAAREMGQVADQFQKQTASQQHELARQTRRMADQLQQAADSSEMTSRMQKQLQQMGADESQAAKMTQQLERAAAGDTSAEQQLRQQADQLAGQAGNAAPQMRQQLQQSLQQMQGQLAAAQSAQQLAQSSRQLSEAMDQNNPQQMNSAAQSMQQELARMDSLQQQVQQMKDMQQTLSQAAAQQQMAANGMQPGPGMASAAAGGQSSGMSETSGQGGSKAGMGHADVPPADPTHQSTYTTRAEHAPQDANPDSPRLAGDYVNAPAIKGESHIRLSQLQQATAQEAAQAGEIQHIPPAVREAVKDYFDFSR